MDPAVLASLGTLMSGGFLIGYKMQTAKMLQIPVVVETPYAQYETTPSIAEMWFNSNRVGLCDICGLDDAPLVVRSPQYEDSYTIYAFALGYNLQNKCKWCVELAKLNYHLERNGTRRLNA